MIFSDFFNLLSATRPFQKIKICKSFWKRKMWVFQVIRCSYRYLATIPVSVGDFFHKLCKLTYYGKTTLDLNSIGIFFIKSTIIITIFIFRGHKYMLFAGWEVRIVKNCDRGLENAARGRRPRAAFSRPMLLPLCVMSRTH